MEALLAATVSDLPDDAARLLRMLSLFPGAGCTTVAAAALADIPQVEADRLLRVLAKANLVEADHRDGIDRWLMQDLVRAFACQSADQTETATDLQRALSRLVHHYLAGAVAADLVLIPRRWHLGPIFAQTPARVFATSQEAIGWLEAELPDILAVQQAAANHGLHAQVWQIAEALWGLCVIRKPYRDWLSAYETGLESARTIGNVRAQARMLTGQASAHLNLQAFPEATTLCHRALEILADTGHHLDEAAVLESLGIAYQGMGTFDDAAHAFEDALTLHQAADRPRGAAIMARRLGSVRSDQDRMLDALTYLDHALTYFTADHDDYNQARTLGLIALVHLRASRTSDAARRLEEALTLAVGVGARHEEAELLVLRATLAGRTGDVDARRADLSTAHAIYVDLDAPQADRTAQLLDARPA